MQGNSEVRTIFRRMAKEDGRGGRGDISCHPPEGDGWALHSVVVRGTAQLVTGVFVEDDKEPAADR